MNRNHVKLGLRQGQFMAVPPGCLGSAIPMPMRPSGAYSSAGTPYSARGTPYGMAPAPFTAAGTPYSATGTTYGVNGRTYRAAAEGDENAVARIASVYNPCVESVLDPSRPTQWVGGFSFFTTTLSVGGYHELTIGNQIRNGNMIVVLPSRNAQPDIFIMGRATNDTGYLLPFTDALIPSRDLYTSYTKGRTVAMHVIVQSASQSTTGARTPGYLHGFALQSLRDIPTSARSPNELMTQTVTPKDQSLQNDTFGGVAAIMAPDAVTINLKQFSTDQVESSNTAWHMDIGTTQIGDNANVAVLTVPNTEFVFNDRPVVAQITVRMTGNIANNTVQVRFNWLSMDSAGNAVAFAEGGEIVPINGTDPHVSLYHTSSTNNNITRRLVTVSINHVGTGQVTVLGGRFTVQGYLDEGQFTTPYVFMPTAFDNTSNITVRYRFADQVVPNSVLMPDIMTSPTSHSSMTNEDIEACAALFGINGPLRRVMSLEDYKMVIANADKYVLGGNMPRISDAYRAAGAREAANRAMYRADGFLDFLGNMGKGIVGALPAIGQIASAVAPLLMAPPEGQNRKPTGYCAGPTEQGEQPPKFTVYQRPPVVLVPANGKPTGFAADKERPAVTFGGRGRKGMMQLPKDADTLGELMSTVLPNLTVTSARAIEKHVLKGERLPPALQGDVDALSRAYSKQLSQQRAATNAATQAAEDAASVAASELLEEPGDDEAPRTVAPTAAMGTSEAGPSTMVEVAGEAPPAAEGEDASTMLNESVSRIPGQRLNFLMASKPWEPEDQMASTEAQKECLKHSNSKALLQALRVKGRRRRLAMGSILCIKEQDGVVVTVPVTLFAGVIPVSNNTSMSQYITVIGQNEKGETLHTVHISTDFFASEGASEYEIEQAGIAQQQIIRAAVFSGRPELYFSVVGSVKVAGPSCGAMAALVASGATPRDLYISAGLEFGDSDGMILPYTSLMPVGSTDLKIEFAVGRKYRLILPWQAETREEYIAQPTESDERVFVGALEMLKADPPEYFSVILAQTMEEVVATVLQIAGAQLGIQLTAKGKMAVDTRAEYRDWIASGKNPHEFEVATPDAVYTPLDMKQWEELKMAVDLISSAAERNGAKDADFWKSRVEQIQRDVTKADPVALVRLMKQAVAIESARRRRSDNWNRRGEKPNKPGGKRAVYKPRRAALNIGQGQ